MNTELHTIPETVVAVASLESTAPPLWRIQLVRGLHLLGIILTFLGTADFLNLLTFMPVETAQWLMIAGPTLATLAKPFVMLIGDYLDDGVRNDSFKIDKLPIVLFLLGISFIMSSCEGLHLQSLYGNFDSTAGGGIYTPPTRPIAIPLHTSK